MVIDSMNNVKIKVENLSLYYGDSPALKNINMHIYNQSVTALIGPSGCGKSSFLRCLNRMNDFIPNARVEGNVYLDGLNIYSSNAELIELRKSRDGISTPQPFPMSIYDNVAFGPRLHGIKDREKLTKLLKAV